VLHAAEDVDRRALEPLRRKPKQLSAPPSLFSDGARPLIADRGDTRGTGAGDVESAGGQGVLLTGQSARLRGLDELLEGRVADPEILRMAHRIARRLAIRRRPQDRRADRGAGPLASVPYRYRSDDIDLDRTIDVLTERPVPEQTDIIVRERMSSRRAAVVVVDVSGSMRGEKVRIAAATVAALCADFAHDQLGLVAFWSDAALLAPLGTRVTPDRLLDQLLRIPARGLTNIEFGLAVARAELARSSARRRMAVLLSDAVHNAGPDPRTTAQRFGQLHVLCEIDGEHDTALARDLARLGHGGYARIATHRDVAPALNRLLAS
jgi:Mg-chelatase subunit ChlD